MSTSNLSTPEPGSPIFTWTNLTITAPGVAPKTLLASSSGALRRGRLTALLGPSGSGKTSLLSALACRPLPGLTVPSPTSYLSLQAAQLRQLVTFVEQEDHLIGSLTVLETLQYAARLAGVPDSEQGERVRELLKGFGLESVRDVVVGTPLKRGISGGQKRRVSVACQMVLRGRQVCFLDEPTSGLDATAALEVVRRVREVAEKEDIAVLASIHQAGARLWELVDDVIVLAKGRTVYAGPRDGIAEWFGVPEHGWNEAEWVMEVCDVDFAEDQGTEQRLDGLIQRWEAQEEKGLTSVSHPPSDVGAATVEEKAPRYRQPGTISQTLILLRRLFVKSYRDPLAYWLRVVMYLCLAFLMGFVWFRLAPNEPSVQPLINNLFFSGAFMSFMAVAYVPAYLEDLAAYNKDSLDGLASPLPFILSNFLVGLPFIFLNTVLFSIITAFICNLQASHDAARFWKYVMYLFLDLLAAESLVVLVSTLLPIFVAALAVTAFANGLWMSTGGFLVSERVLNTFWYHTFYWIDYQRYVFEGMMWNELTGRTFEADAPEGGLVTGEEVLSKWGYSRRREGLWIGVVLALTVVMRGIAGVVLWWRGRR